MNFKVEKAVLDSGVKKIFAVVEGIDNHRKDEEWQAYRTKRIAELYNSKNKRHHSATHRK